MSTLSPRRKPQQERSRERVRAIVEAARRLVGEHGNDAVSVRDIAAAAGVPIASVYQYFPEKNAILRVLIVGYLDAIRAELGSVLEGVAAPEDLPGAAADLVDALVGLFRREPALATIWSAVQANTVLREIDMDDTREMARFLGALFHRVIPAADPGELFGACLYAAHTVPTTLRIAHLAPPDERDLLIEETKLLMRLRVSDIVERARRGC